MFVILDTSPWSEIRIVNLSLPVSDLPVHSLTGDLRRANVLHFGRFSFIRFSQFVLSVSFLRNQWLKTKISSLWLLKPQETN